VTFATKKDLTIVGLTRDLLMGLSWAVNVAEWIIRRRSVTSRDQGLRLDLAAPPA
jgi:hypothetical protein